MKQVIVVNGALRLPIGKLAAQVAHAAVAALLSADTPTLEAWLEAGMPKIVLRANDATQVQALADAARAAGLPSAVIHDADKTVIAAGTLTCAGIGPATSEAIDAITGKLSLL